MIMIRIVSAGLLGIIFLLLIAGISSGENFLKKTADHKDSTERFWLDETAWQKLMEEPASRFLMAQESLSRNDKKTAARNISKGVNIINIEILRAAKDMKPKLSNVVDELLLFVQDLNNNKEIIESDLERAFLRAESILVQHKLAKADIYIAAGFLKNAAYALEAACRHILYSQIWNPRKISNENSEVIKKTQEEMLFLIDSENWSSQQIIDVRNLLKHFLKKN